MAILASTQVLVAGPLLPCVVSVLRVSLTPPRVVNVVWAETTVWPVTPEVIDTWQEPVPPAVVQLLIPPTNVPGPASIVKVISVPSGALINPTPSPRSALTWPVNVWLAPTRLVPGGLMEMFASWKTFVASPLLGGTASVDTVNGAEPATDRVAVAWPVTVPVVRDVKVMVHLPAASVF